MIDFSLVANGVGIRAQTIEILRPLGYNKFNYSNQDGYIYLQAVDKYNSAITIQLPTTLDISALRYYLINYYPELFI